MEHNMKVIKVHFIIQYLNRFIHDYKTEMNFK